MVIGRQRITVLDGDRVIGSVGKFIKRLRVHVRIGACESDLIFQKTPINFSIIGEIFLCEGSAAVNDCGAPILSKELV